MDVAVDGAELVGAVDEVARLLNGDDPRTVLHGLARGACAGKAETDHHHVGVEFFVPGRIGLGRHHERRDVAPVLVKRTSRAVRPLVGPCRADPRCGDCAGHPERSCSLDEVPARDVSV